MVHWYIPHMFRFGLYALLEDCSLVAFIVHYDGQIKQRPRFLTLWCCFFFVFVLVLVSLSISLSVYRCAWVFECKYQYIEFWHWRRNNPSQVKVCRFYFRYNIFQRSGLFAHRTMAWFHFAWPAPPPYSYLLRLLLTRSLRLHWLALCNWSESEQNFHQTTTRSHTQTHTHTLTHCCSVE